MKANELMLGDWVYYSKFDRYVKITEINEDNVNSNIIRPLLYGEIEPIPLTQFFIIYFIGVLIAYAILYRRRIPEGFGVAMALIASTSWMFVFPYMVLFIWTRLKNHAHRRSNKNPEEKQ